MNRLPLVILIGGLLAGCHQPPPPTGPEEKPPVTPQNSLSLLDQLNQENIALLSHALPSIVRITSHLPAPLQLEAVLPSTPGRPGKPHGPRFSDVAYGSGVIIAADGTIVTNHHVIDGAETVDVELHDKRTFTAKVVASDEPMDIAVLKIEASGLPAMQWGDSDKVKVGEQVFAIGNPFNLEDSASRGIVSATGRNLPDGPAETVRYENFIQTDAAINPGNSGGALINTHGELIGINTAMASTSRGNMGVGFAIPSNLARYAVEGLLKDGRLIRGYLGVKLPDSVDDGVNAMLKLESSRGVLLAGVQKGSPAEKAGLCAGDFITSLGGHMVDSEADFRLVESQLVIGKDVTVAYIRSGTPQTAQVRIVEQPAPQGNTASTAATASGLASDIAASDNVLKAVQVAALDDTARKKYRIDDTVTSGVLVSHVNEGSAAEQKGIKEGDVIENLTVRGTASPLSDVKQFSDLAATLPPGQGVVLLIHHGQASSFVYLAPAK